MSIGCAHPSVQTLIQPNGIVYRIKSEALLTQHQTLTQQAPNIIKTILPSLKKAHRIDIYVYESPHFYAPTVLRQTQHQARMLKDLLWSHHIDLDRIHINGMGRCDATRSKNCQAMVDIHVS